MDRYFVSREHFAHRGRPRRIKAKGLPGWNRIARRLYDALNACDWSFGRAQSPEVHERIRSAMDLALRKATAVGKGRPGRARKPWDAR